ncbi:MAG: nucleoside-diphosphate kinase, partial [Vulcanococcus sp.]
MPSGRAATDDGPDTTFFVMAAERTFVAIKPDGVQRGLVGEILGRFERKGFKLVG